MLDLQELSDRLEIQDLQVRYSQLLDRFAFDDMDALFTDDAILDYSQTGAAKGTWPEQKAFIANAFQGFKGTQHILGLPSITVSGDRATARTICFNPMVINDKKVFYVGIWYDDDLVRVDGSWKFKQRVEELSFFDGL
ncbi:MAG: hypothetical protein JWO22_3634 [Frankiales bacterium]|nr:hypothetical protein [Frankiales bacterium]